MEMGDETRCPERNIQQMLREYGGKEIFLNSIVIVRKRKCFRTDSKSVDKPLDTCPRLLELPRQGEFRVQRMSVAVRTDAESPSIK